MWIVTVSVQVVVMLLLTEVMVQLSASNCTVIHGHVRTNSSRSCQVTVLPGRALDYIITGTPHCN